MTLPFDWQASYRHPPRDGRRGAILIEALISFAMIAIFAALVLNTLSSDLSSRASREDEYWLAEFARSKAEEFAARPYLPAGGTTEDGIWAWSSTQERVWPDGKSTFDNDIALFEVALKVWRSDLPEQTYAVTTIVARRP